jgi:hypothetical protein
VFHDPTGAEERPNGERSWENVVSHGVHLGYKIIEEQIQQGRRVAQAVKDQSHAAGATGNDLPEVAERLLRFYTDLGALCFDLIENLARSPVLNGEAFRGAKGESADRAGGAAEGAGTGAARSSLSVEVIATCPTQVSLDLRGTMNGSSPSVHALHALDADKPPLRDIRFDLDTAHAFPSVRIVIPPGQPPDTYTGAVIDRGSNLPLGTLCVRIGERADN